MGKTTYKDSMNKSGESEFYETFDSGKGVMIPKDCEADFDHQDAGAGLSRDADIQHGAIPTMPQK